MLPIRELTRWGVSTMAKRVPTLSGFKITSPKVRGATFFSIEAAREFCPDALAFEKAVSEYQADGCEVALIEDLQGLGFSWNEIAGVISNPSHRPRAGYAMSADCR